MNEVNPRKKELALLVPLLNTRARDVERLAVSLGGAKSREFTDSQKNLGVDKESWFLASSSERDYVIVYVEGKDVMKSLNDLIGSDTRFDLWIKTQVAGLTGIDWNNPTNLVLPRQILRYGY
jgi:hypothetical protein